MTDINERAEIAKSDRSSLRSLENCPRIISMKNATDSKARSVTYNLFPKKGSKCTNSPSWKIKENVHLF